MDSWQAVPSACSLPDILPPILEQGAVAAGMLIRQSQVLDVFVGGDGDDGLDHLVKDPLVHVYVVVLDSKRAVPCKLDTVTNDDVEREQPLYCHRACAC